MNNLNSWHISCELLLEPRPLADYCSSMRISFLSLILVISGTAFAGPIKAVRVWPNYRTEDSFERISEYLGGGEHKNSEVVLRTHDQSREGYYFFGRFHNPGASVEGAKVELHVLYPNEVKARVFTNFPALTLHEGDNVLNVGLTGNDWPNAKLNPIAWQVRLLGPDGAELAQEQSFLWR